MGPEYENVRNRIVERIETLTDNGKPLDIKVHKREDVFSGPYLVEAPDLMVEVREPGYGLGNPRAGVEVRELLPGTVFSNYPGEGGRHDMNGIFAAQGPYIEAGKTIEAAEITDIAPTVLHLMGHAIPDDIDGKVLPIFKANTPPDVQPVEIVSAEERAPAAAAMTAEEQEHLQAVLKGFGYLG
jgi:predicted AlkP superfamily phosphohydrolase/phosphomutase